MLRAYLNLLIFLLYPFGCEFAWNALESPQHSDYCLNSNLASVAGGSHGRLVPEGGRIVLICCLPGNTTGHDHEQLTWTDPQGKSIIQYFSNAIQAASGQAYSVPDFSDKNRLLTRLVVRDFQERDSGAYTCGKSQGDAVTPAKVMLMMRPRLLADFPSPPPVEDDETSTSVANGHRVSVPLEEGGEGRLICYTNPTFKGPIRVTWFSHGRQLIGPAASMLDEVSTTEKEEIGFGSSTGARQRANRFDVEKQPKKYLDTTFRAVVVDPAELGVTIENDSQELHFSDLNSRHAGMYMCKAEAPNPMYKPPSRYPSPSYGTSLPSEKGGDGIQSEFLVQIQPIRLIVFSRPRMLPGNPRLVPTPIPQSKSVRPGSSNMYTTVFKHRFSPVLSASLERLRRDATVEKLNGEQRTRDSLWNLPDRPVAREGEQMILECAARGSPPPKLSWFKGGGTSLPPQDDINSAYRDINFDVAIHEALSYLPLIEAKLYLGTPVTENSQLFPAIDESMGRVDTDVRKIEVEDNFLGQRDVDFSGTRLGRFSVISGLRKDDAGVPVIAVSRLIIDQLQVSDATRYTCLAQLDMKPLGGHGNWTDVGSILPAIIMRPQFIAAGTKLYAAGNPGDNATLTCEAFGGLSVSGGLKLTLLRGAGLKELAEFAGTSKGASSGDELDEILPVSSASSSPVSSHSPSSPAYFSSGDSFLRQDEMAGRESGRKAVGRFGENIEVIKPGMDPRYQVTAGPDPKNPYSAQIKLTISDLRPQDNNYYACEAQSGDNWVSYAPPVEETLGRLTVWFAPPYASPPPIQDDPDSQSKAPMKGDVMYGLAHKPSRLECRAMGQPTPQWSWKGPAIRKSIAPVSTGQKIESDGYIVRVHQEGEESVSELTLPAAYWNFGIFGSYACTATNRLGTTTGYVRLKLATHPQRPNVTACTVEATLVELCVIPPRETGGLPLTHYELRIQPSPKERFHGPFAYLPGRRVVRLPDLTPNHFYRFAFSAVTPAGRGPNTYLQVMTRKIGVPRLRLVASDTDVTTSEYLVRWLLESNGGSPVIKYHIKIRPVATYWGTGQTESSPLDSWTAFDSIPSKLTDTETTHGTEGVFRIKGLEPGTTYEVNLVGQNSVGTSAPYVVLFKTSEISGTRGKLLGEPISQHFRGNAEQSRLVLLLVLLPTLRLLLLGNLP